MLPKLSGELVGAGIDYLTITTRLGPKLESARALAYAIASSELDAGMFGRPWVASGYEGFRVGHISFGERGDGALMRLGSEVAQRHCVDALRVSDNVTRLDLQGTFRVSEKPSVVIRRHYRELKRFRNGKKKAPAVAMMLGHDGGSTVYSGRRSSDVFGRIYDKGIESKLDQWANTVRYEMELKGRRAQHVSTQVTGSQAELPGMAIGALRFFASRGCVVRPLIDSIQCRMSFDTVGSFDRTSDVARTLEWLRVQVRPSVMALGHRGLLQSVYESLGMDHVVHRLPDSEHDGLIH